AEAGDYNAMLWLARMYRDGKGVRKNASKALEWYKKSKDHNIYSKFELLGLLSGYKKEFKDVPKGLTINIREKEKLFVWRINSNSLRLLTDLFPFTHYDIVGYSYMDETQPGHNEGCDNYDKILIADLEGKYGNKKEPASILHTSKNIITVRIYQGNEKFDGDAIICDFDNEEPDRATWVLVPNELNGLVWFYSTFKTFIGLDSSECNYVVDMQNHFSQMMEYDNIGHYNPWDYYFQPISSLSLNEAYRKKGVIISAWIPKNRAPAKFKPSFSENIKMIIEQESEKFKGRDKVIGVICRGTEFISMQPYDHDVPLDEYELIEIVEERMRCLGFTDVYLNTEDQDAHEAFSRHFGSKVFAIDQKRFKKERALNPALFDQLISEPFGKLIQGERYLTATYLVLKCDSALICSGSGSSFVQNNAKDKLIEKHIKGRWGQFGNNPLLIRSHNKNHIDLRSAIVDERHSFVDNSGHLHIIAGKKVMLRDVDTCLYPNTEYVCSLSSTKPVSVTLTLSSYKGGEEKTVNFIDKCVFSLPFYSHLGTLIVECDSDGDNTVGIQIEKGTVPTEYEPPRYSETQLCLKGTDNKEYNPKDASYIDFNKRVVLVNGKEIAIRYEEVEKYNKIICYNGGFITYHCGETKLSPKRTLGPRSAMTSVGKTPLAPNKVIGWPKQLRRISYTCELAEHIIRNSNEERERAIRIYIYQASKGSNNAKVVLSRLYREGIHVERDINASMMWMRCAISENNSNLLKHELIDMDLRWGNYEDCCDAHAIALSLYRSGDSVATAYLARMYRDGKGVERDLDKAIELMRDAQRRGVPWARNELFDMLWKHGSNDFMEAFKVICPTSAAGDPEAMARLSKMYHDGRGVERDLDKAIELMRNAAIKKVGWARNVIVNYLHERGKPDDLKEAFDIAFSFAIEGDGGAMGRLAQMYRDGQGVERDLDKAIEWMKKAVEKNVSWAEKELYTMLNESEKSDPAFINHPSSQGS
ncbi:MAG: hypothetical protein EOM59_16575, partial [Clostridia bacterium]|nr:hypothetical protein [Clostridia bacterium]